MQKVNDATQSTLDNFRRKAAELPFSQHPYSSNRKALTMIGRTEWDEEHRKAAIKATSIWVLSIVGSGIADTLNEIVALMHIAANTGDEEHKKAADNMASSMNFVEALGKNFINQIDADYIAEALFEDGLKIEKERAEEEAAAEAAKAKVKAHAEQQQKKQTPEVAPDAQLKQGALHRWQPSVN